MAEKDRKYYARNRDKIKQKNAERNRLKRSKRHTSGSLEGANNNVLQDGTDSVSRPPLSVETQIHPNIDASILHDDLPRTWNDTAVQATPEILDQDFNLRELFRSQTTTSTSTHGLEAILDGHSKYAALPALMELPPTFTALVSTTYKQYDFFLAVREQVECWSSIWGGVENWEQSLNILFMRSITKGHSPTREVVRQVYRWCEKGQIILSSLDELQGRLPCDPLAYSLLWKYHNEQVKLLVKGITILDCRLKGVHQSLQFPGGLEYHSVLSTLFKDRNTPPSD